MDGSQGQSHPPPPPTTISKKREHGKEVIQLLEKPAKVVTFIFNVTPSTELKKLITKQQTKNPWDILLAQMLSRIDHILSPKKIGIEDYKVTFHIPHILPKPGLPLVSEEHYGTVSTQINKIVSQNPTVNIIILQKPAATVVKEVPTNSSTQDEDELDAGSLNTS
ncbi:hypothetical protein EDD16DRAFT_1699572 [Pisolithus croceorrhizus]|nr:hypothetical protein EV401DRAFT_2065796 [Pisolithus croceorrhizus]KAI6132431.1 hypothetical protein EDD16DRAFT_1699572 [Pisolithus croceorrhizus]